MRALLVAQKTLKELVREPKLVLLALGLPVVFLGIFAASSQSPLVPTYAVVVPPSLGPRGAALVRALATDRLPDGRPAFKLTPWTDEAARDQGLRRGTTHAALIIEEGPPFRVTMHGDGANARYLAAATTLGRALEARTSTTPAPIALTVSRATPDGPVTEFDLYAPGLVVFALLLLGPETAILIAREVRWRTLRRLRLTRLGAGELFLGVTLAQLVMGLLQVALVLLAAPLFGFHGRGLGLATLAVGGALALSGIGAGLLVGCFVTSDGQASNVGGAVMMVQVFLSGSFFPMPPLTVAHLAGHPIGAFDFIPATHGLIALRGLLVDGASLEDVLFRFGATLALSLAYFLIGVAVFRHLRMRLA